MFKRNFEEIFSKKRFLEVGFRPHRSDQRQAEIIPCTHTQEADSAKIPFGDLGISHRENSHTITSQNRKILSHASAPVLSISPTSSNIFRQHPVFSLTAAKSFLPFGGDSADSQLIPSCPRCLPLQLPKRYLAPVAPARPSCRQIDRLPQLADLSHQ